MEEPGRENTGGKTEAEEGRSRWGSEQEARTRVTRKTRGGSRERLEGPQGVWMPDLSQGLLQGLYLFRSPFTHPQSPTVIVQQGRLGGSVG